MKDVEYVREVLSQDYDSELPREIPYPLLDTVIEAEEFDYLSGMVEGERPNGSQSREGKDYLWFNHGEKSILTHRFIAALTIGKWVPRAFHVDHINHDPSDNRPQNLRIVTPRDNAGNRRKVLLSELADLDALAAELAERKEQVTEQTQPVPEIEVAEEIGEPVVPPPRVILDEPRDSYETHPQSWMGSPKYTGETMPAKYAGPYGGAWYKTTLGSWHLLFETPAELKEDSN